MTNTVTLELVVYDQLMKEAKTGRDALEKNAKGCGWRHWQMLGQFADKLGVPFPPPPTPQALEDASVSGLFGNLRLATEQVFLAAAPPVPINLSSAVIRWTEPPVNAWAAEVADGGTKHVAEGATPDLAILHLANYLRSIGRLPKPAENTAEATPMKAPPPGVPAS